MKKLFILLFSILFSCSALAVDMELTDLEGRKVKLSDYLGKWVVVNYWATWCPPCREEMPELQSFHDAHADKDGVVLGINTEVIGAKTIQEFLNDYFVTYPNFVNGPVSKTPLGRVPGLPTSFVVSPQGDVAAMQVGGVTREMIEKFMEKWEAKNKK
jgi:thiol-disulfide isomerase/thioredoxin